jgi:signal peptidase
LLCAVAVGPLVALVLLPVGLGLQRYVMDSDSMGGAMPRGSLLLERVVPVSDLEVGDVITFDAPSGTPAAGRVTHRIVSIEPQGIRTRGDDRPADDPWVLRPDGPALPRVVLDVPLVGWAYLLFSGVQGWLLALGSAFVLAFLSRRAERRKPRLVQSPSAEVPEPVGCSAGGRRERHEP